MGNSDQRKTPFQGERAKTQLRESSSEKQQIMGREKELSHDPLD